MDRAFGWFNDTGYTNYARKQPDSARRLAQLGSNRPPVLYFWYREAPRYLMPAEGGAVGRDNPPAAERGNLEMRLDSEGRLLQFQAWPEDAAATPASADFQKLLAAAGFDASKMVSAEPAWIPPSAFDARAAWTGKEGSDSVRVEAAAWRGRIVALERQLPWKVTAPASGPTQGGITLAGFFFVLSLVAAAVAWRNLRLGRGDKRGANRLAGFMLVCTLTAELLRSHHVPTGIEVGVILFALRDALIEPALVWLVYVAFEPYLRRYVPNILIGWSRLLEGRWRDPLVGGNLLAGAAVGMGMGLIVAADPGPGNPTANVSLPVDGSGSVAWLASQVLTAVAVTLLFTLLWLLIRIPARRDWLASVLMILIILAVAAPQSIAAGWGAILGALVFFIIFGLGTLVLVRLGVLTMVAFLFTYYCAMVGNAPWTTSVSVWYARTMMLAIAAILAVAIYGFRTTLAGRPLLRDELQKDVA